ncbi:MAG TPA: VWA domain-containing protein [Blastocatellia bacterium]|nr:VWA domain-containing protein [Blastocatellia bacterium]
MKHVARVTLSILLVFVTAFAQSASQKPADDQVIRIGVDLVQIDVVVTDRSGKVARGLSKNDFELYENGRKQVTSFFEFVESGKGRSRATPEKARASDATLSPQAPGGADLKRIFAFVVDDLTIGYEDLVYVRQMLGNFIETEMQAGDLVAIVRTVGGKGLLQQFTTDKDLLRRAVAALTPVSHQYAAFNNPDLPVLTPQQTPGGDIQVKGTADQNSGLPNTESQLDDTNRALRAFMSLGTAGFVVDSMRELPGRKSLVLISGGLPLLSTSSGTESTSISNFLNALTDKATRASVAINTMDIRGMKSFSGVASFDDTPARGALGVPSQGQRSTASIVNDPRGTGGGFGRIPDETMFGDKNPFDQLQAHAGLRALSSATGGIDVLDKNNFSEGLQKIINANDGYYLLAYTPSDGKFNGDFRKVEVKVKGDGLKVYTRRGYLAREEKTSVAPVTKQEQLLAAIRSPLARREVDFDAMLLYKPAGRQGAIDIDLVIDPSKLRFEQIDDKRQVDLDVAGFVYDQLGKLRGGFSEKISAALNPEDYSKVIKGGLSYSANTVLPPGGYQIRIAVRDNKTESIGTLSRYIEVADLSKGTLTASSLLLAAVPAGELKAEKPTPISANRRVSRTQDLRYAVMIYNAKQKESHPQVRTQLIISHEGQVLFKQPEEAVTSSAKDQAHLIKWGQLALSGVKPGRYTMTLVIKDELADRKAQTLTRSMEFVVVE